MAIITAKLIARIARTASIESFRFVPQEKFDFLPGQFVQFLFDEANSGNKELNKYLSLSSSPTQGYIEVTKRLSDSLFSQKLKGLGISDTVKLNAPLGTCVFKEEYEKIGFLIGGIGITPVISIIGYIVDNHLPTDVCLVYSNRSEEEIAFKQKLDQWRNVNLNIKVSFVVTECLPKDNTCIFGRIDKDLIKGRMCDITERVIFIFGPPRMVEAMNAISLEHGLKPEQIKKENFIGY